jgi:radical SAM superfamily enzyme YgiQ (UPF0313 family)
MNKTKKLSKDSQITLVELPPTEFGELLTTENNGRKISSDVYTNYHLPARGIHVLEAILRDSGYSDVQSINPLYHGDNGRLTKDNLERIFNSDIVAISAISRTSKQSAQLMKWIRSVNQNIIGIVGGPHYSYKIEDGLKDSHEGANADIIVIGEGEKTLIELTRDPDVLTDPKSLEGISGIAYKNGGEIIRTPERELLTPDELSALPHPYYDPITRQKVNIGVLQTSRGCPWGCNFCIVTKLYGRVYRKASVEYSIEGLRQIQNMGVTVFYLDDNLAGDTEKDLEHSKKLLETIIDKGLTRRYSIAQVSVNAAKDSEFLQLAKQAGIDYVCVGVESFNDESLKKMKKPANLKKNIEALMTFRDAGFLIHGMMMPGGDGDTLESLEHELEQAKKYFLTVQFFSSVPIPGTPFTCEMEKQNRILSYDSSLFCGDFVTVKPKNMTPYELQIKIKEMYQGFYSKEHLQIIKNDPVARDCRGLWMYRNIYNGIRNVLVSDQMQEHLEFLKKV